MIDRAIRTTATWDWVTPLWAMWLDWRRRPAVQLVLPWPWHMTQRQLSRLLARHGIQSWGWMVTYDDEMIFSVRQRDEYRTWAVLRTL